MPHAHFLRLQPGCNGGGGYDDDVDDDEDGDCGGAGGGGSDGDDDDGFGGDDDDEKKADYVDNQDETEVHNDNDALFMQAKFPIQLMSPTSAMVSLLTAGVVENALMEGMGGASSHGFPTAVVPPGANKLPDQSICTAAVSSPSVAAARHDAWCSLSSLSPSVSPLSLSRSLSLSVCVCVSVCVCACVCVCVFFFSPSLSRSLCVTLFSLYLPRSVGMCVCVHM
jgi:hypothetical protein